MQILSQKFAEISSDSSKNEKKGPFEILNDTGAYVTLVQLMDKFGDLNHAVSIYFIWIYNFNDKKELPLVK